MFESIPHSADRFVVWRWTDFQPYFDDLEKRTLTGASVSDWLTDWSHAAEYAEETYWRLYVATNVNTQDTKAEAEFQTFLSHTQPAIRIAEQKLKESLIKSGLQPDGFEIALRNIQAESSLYRESNLTVLAEEKSLGVRYQQIRGAQSISWGGKELPLLQLNPYIASTDRVTREQAWRLMSERRLEDRGAVNDVWSKMVKVRHTMATNSDLPNFLNYRWKQLFRFAYTPDDCLAFHDAIQEVCVPAATRIYERRKKKLGLTTLRPWDAAWDLNVDSEGQIPLKPFQSIPELVSKTAAIFERLDATLGRHFDLMVRENLLDLEVRPSKAAGAYCTTFAASKRPYIFMNAVRLHSDVLTLIHESGHAFHWCESYGQRYFHNRGLDYQPIEFVEVASTAMEYLASPFFDAPDIGFYSPGDAVRAEIEHLEAALLFWPNMALMDSIQMWVYTHEDEAADPRAMDAKWVEYSKRYIPEIDWNGLATELESAWQLKGIMFEAPLYYVEYGLAQLAAVQIWDQARVDGKAALAQYRNSLSLGSARSLQDLYEAAGVKLAWDAPTLRIAVTILEARLEQLYSMT